MMCVFSVPKVTPEDFYYSKVREDEEYKEYIGRFTEYVLGLKEQWVWH